MNSLAAIVADYFGRISPERRLEQTRFRKLPSLGVAIAEAALSKRADGRRHPHHCRRPERVLQQFRMALGRREKWLRAARNFDELHAEIWKVGEGIHGVGPLLCYDTAVAIGSDLRLKPRSVYVHAGVRKGVKALGFGRIEPRLSPSIFPGALRDLKADELEDVLCIYAADLAAITSRKP